MDHGDLYYPSGGTIMNLPVLFLEVVIGGISVLVDTGMEVAVELVGVIMLVFGLQLYDKPPYASKSTESPRHIGRTLFIP